MSKNWILPAGFDLIGALVWGAIISTLFFVPNRAQAQYQGAQGYPTFSIMPLKYLNITTDATTTVKSGHAYLHTICINTVAATETITIYDSTTATGTKVGTITLAAGDEGKCWFYDADLTTGLTLVTAVAASDITVSYL